MTAELLIAIAELCRVVAGLPPSYQLKCQQEYIACIIKKGPPFNNNLEVRLSDCVMEKKL